MRLVACPPPRLHVGRAGVFLGPNGAGKSTTILMLTTLLPPTSGTASVAGHDIVREGSQVRAAIGAALQEAGLDPLLSGREHLFLQAALHSLPLSEELADLCLRRPSQTPSWRESRDYQPIQAPPADPEPMCPLHSRPILRTLGPCR